MGVLSLVFRKVWGWLLLALGLVLATLRFSRKVAKDAVAKERGAVAQETVKQVGEANAKIRDIKRRGNFAKQLHEKYRRD